MWSVTQWGPRLPAGEVCWSIDRRSQPLPVPGDEGARGTAEVGPEPPGSPGSSRTRRVSAQPLAFLMSVPWYEAGAELRVQGLGPSTSLSPGQDVPSASPTLSFQICELRRCCPLSREAGRLKDRAERSMNAAVTVCGGRPAHNQRDQHLLSSSAPRWPSDPGASPSTAPSLPPYLSRKMGYSGGLQPRLRVSTRCPRCPFRLPGFPRG
uniref:Uncharacterized protein n=1 Tax=Molossus molossus TaxID=27622 RepID=A0A7J8F9S3_MOLMO|nr:hypothetical protein HJG59_008606 [Molossus molossus]